MAVIGAPASPARVFAVAACLLVIGCGNESEGGSAGESVGLDSEPARLVKSMVDTTAKARTSKDCTEVAKINRRSPSKIVCPPVTAEMREGNRKTRVVRAATYGTAAVVDFEAPGARDGASVVLYRDPAGRWIVGRWGLSYGAMVGTGDGDSREETRAALDRYLGAVRDRDCDAYVKYAVTDSSDPDKVCADEFPVTRDLARILEARPDIGYLGGNEDLAFYSVSARNKRYTVSIVATSEGSLRPRIAMDATEAPTS
jgi:hypothetical protein